MPFYDAYPTAAPVLQPPRLSSPINRLTNKVEHFLDHILIKGSHGQSSFPAAGIPLAELQQLADTLVVDSLATMIDLHVVPWYMKWWNSGPVSHIVVHF